MKIYPYEDHELKIYVDVHKNCYSEDCRINCFKCKLQGSCNLKALNYN